MKQIRKGAQNARITSPDCIHFSFGINKAFTADKNPPLGEHIMNWVASPTPRDTQIIVLVFGAAMLLFSLGGSALRTFQFVLSCLRLPFRRLLLGQFCYLSGLLGGLRFPFHTLTHRRHLLF